MGEDYFLRESVADIAWHTEAIADHLHDEPLILIKKTTNRELAGATQIFIRSKNQKNIFVAATSALDHLNLSVQDAKIYSSNSGYTIDTFFVLNQDGKPLGSNPTLLKKIQQTLQEELRLADNYSEVISRRTPRRLKYFAMPTPEPLIFAYFVGGLSATYLRRGDVVIIPIRLGVGVRLGANVGYMKFSEKSRWLPF